MTSKYYAGIGSRNTPTPICEAFTRVAKVLNQQGWTLRSGGAYGADTAFESGAGENKEIYLPWKDFNGGKGICLEDLNSEDRSFATRMARHAHPNYDILKPAVKKLMDRNSLQVFGQAENDKRVQSSFIICYSPGGKLWGGTSQALRLADMADIPVIDLAQDAMDYTRQIEAVQEQFKVSFR